MTQVHRQSVLTFLTILLLFPASSLAESAVPFHAVEIRSIETEIVSQTDGTFRVFLGVHSIPGTQANLILEYPDAIKLSSKNQPSQIIQLSAGETADFVFDFTRQKEEPARVFFQVEAINPPEGYARRAQRFVTVVTRDGDIKLFDSDEPSTGQAGKIYPIQGPIKELQNGEKIHHTVSFSGSFEFLIQDSTEHHGVFGAGCRIWFYNPGTEMWWHPLLGNTRHTHYDFIAEDGSFSFDFEFDANMGNYNEIWIQVSCVNDATIMPAPDDGYMVWHDGGYTPYLGDNDAIIVQVDINSPSFEIDYHKDDMRNDYCSVLRNMMISRDFIEEVYSSSLPFDLPHIPSKVYNQDAGVGGIFKSCDGFNDDDPPSIEIDPDWDHASWVIDHEYGHFQHFCEWDKDCSNVWENGIPEGKIMREGWAIFYASGARSYSQRAYGNEHRWDGPATDKTESTPFADPRYDGIGYQFHGHSDYCAFGCYLSSIFDGYEDSGFEAAPYVDGDNDDVSGQHLRVFESLRTMTKGPVGDQPDLYHAKFKEGLPADVQLSADQILNFMFADLYEIPDDAAMRPAQVSNLVFTIPHSGRLDLHWDVNNYAPLGVFVNPANGFRVYKEEGGWNLVADLPWYYARDYVHEEANVGGLYKVTAYSNISGESCLPEEASISVSAVPGSELQAYRINSVSPNPFNPTTKISFSLAQTSNVKIEVFAMDGRLVRTLFSGQKTQGDHDVLWDGKNDAGSEVASGQYFCQMTAGDMRDARKLTLVK